MVDDETSVAAATSRTSSLLRARFGDLLESTPDAMVMVDAAGRIVLTNRQAERLFGWGRFELLGRPVEDLIPTRFRTAHVKHRGGYFSQPRTRAMGAGLELYGLRKDGAEFPVEVSLSPLRTEEGPMAMSAIRDISERKRFERALQEKNAELESANRELEAFSYSISHDLRAPVRAMAGFARILDRHFSDGWAPEARQALDRIRENALRMGELIDGLLAFSRLSRQPLSKSTVVPAALVNAVLDDLRAEQSGRQVELQIGEMPACEADATLLKQVYANLLSNALKYTRGREPAVIEVGWRKEGDAGVYFVRDNGAGFDMRYSSKLFGVFQRLHSIEEFEGAGVGLAIVHRIVHRHGGRIWVEAQVNDGATFHFTLGGTTCGG
jgi:PAS domain S-box-containing protein